MKRNNRIVGLVALALVTIIAFVILYINDDRSKAGANNNTTTNTENVAPVLDYDEEAIDVAGQEGITAAAKISKDGNFEGYKVTTSVLGYNADILVDVYFDADGETLKHVVVLEHEETRNLGSLVAEQDFLSKFVGIKPPVYVESMDVTKLLPTSETVEKAEPGALIDGFYEVEAERDSKGFVYKLTLTVQDGAITAVVWDATNEAGEHKSYLSSVGKYVMVEGNPTWKEQADALAASVIANQSTEGIVLAENGKTDSVSGVSITVSNFVSMVEDALVLAAGGTIEDTPAPTGDVVPTKLDAITGATVSSEAMMKAVNKAYVFITGYAK